MGDVIKAALMGLLGSKKFLVFVAGLLATLATTKLGLDPEAAQLLATKVVGLTSAYIIGQGIADNGKEAAKLE